MSAPTLYVVRHAQASLGSDNYDQLSELGYRQAALFASWWQQHQIELGGIWRGSLLRHQQTLAALGDAALGSARVHEGLNEYDFQAVYRAYLRFDPEAKAEMEKNPLSVLKEAVLAWSRNQLQAPNLESFADFQMRVSAALKSIRSEMLSMQKPLLVVTSGGVISLLIQRALGLEDDSVTDLNLAMRNTGLTEFRISADRLTLQSFNALPHLAAPEHISLHTRV